MQHARSGESADLVVDQVLDHGASLGLGDGEDSVVDLHGDGPRLPRLHPRSLRIHQKHRFCEIVYRKEGQVDVRAVPLQISDQLRATLGVMIDKSLIDSVVELMT